MWVHRRYLCQSDFSLGVQNAEFTLNAAVTGKRAIKKREAVDFRSVNIQEVPYRSDSAQVKGLLMCLETVGVHLLCQPCGGHQIDFSPGPVPSLGIVCSDVICDSFIHLVFRVSIFRHPAKDERGMYRGVYSLDWPESRWLWQISSPP